jgi:hypothetical protein
MYTSGTNTFIVMSANAAGSVGNGDTIQFSFCPQWNAQHAVSVAVTTGLVIYDPGTSSLQIVTTSGNIGSSIPTFSATAGTVTTDNTAKWTSLGAASNFSAWGAPIARVSLIYTQNSAWSGTGAVFIADNHAEIQGAAISLTTASATLVLAYDVDHTAAVPPGGSNMKSTSQIVTIGNSNINLTAPSSSARQYFDGVVFQAGNGANSTSIQIGAANLNQLALFDNCGFYIPATGSAANITVGLSGHNSKVRWNNTSVSFGAVGQSISITSDDFVWRNSIAFAAGSVIPTNLFNLVNSFSGIIICEGVDFSAMTSGTIFGSNVAASYRVMAVNCKFGSGVTVAATPGAPGSTVDIVISDSTGTTYQQQRYWYEGTLTPSTSIVRTGGASDGLTTISWSIATTANSTFVDPFESMPIPVWNTTTGSNQTVTLYGIFYSTTGTLPANDQIWHDVEYLGSASSPLASLGSGTKANNLAPGVLWPADTSAWDSGLIALGGTNIRTNSHIYATGAMITLNNGTGQVWYCSVGGTTAGSQPGGYTGATDGTSVTDGTATFRAMMRFAMTVTLSAPQPQLVGSLRSTIKAALPSTTFFVEPNFPIPLA